MKHQLSSSRWWDHLVGAAFAIIYVFILLQNASGIAMTRDESFYVDASDQYAHWFELLLKQPSRALKQASIDKYWVANHEHPALAKSVFAWTKMADERYALFDDPSAAYRFGGMLSAGLLLWLIYLWGTQRFNRRVGVMATLFFASWARVFYHSHLDCFDMPITFMVVWTCYAYWRALLSRWWIVGLGIVYGLALATKHNAWIVPGIFLIHWIWLRIEQRKDESTNWKSFVPWWLLSMATIGPILFIVSWPWLWNDGWARFLWYARFHLHHVHYTTTYFGDVLYDPPFPIEMPFVLTGMTTTLSLLMMLAVGLVVRFRTFLPGKKNRLEGDVLRSDVLWMGALLAPIVVIALPSSPIFGGIKHMMPGYPFVALYAGVGFDRVVSSFEEITLTRWKKSIAPLLAVIVLAMPFSDAFRTRKIGLVYYSSVGGGLPGSAELGMNRQFWGFTHGELADFLKSSMPRGGKVWTCDATWTSWRVWQADGAIPKNIQPSWTLPTADYALVHHEHHFEEVDKQIWSAWGSVQPVAVLHVDGVPMVSVYRRAHQR